MTPRSSPGPRRDDARLLVFDPGDGARLDAGASKLSRFLRPGDLVVLNDAATLPASLRARARATPGGELEVRLAEAPEHGVARAVLFGEGDYHTPTERRPPPPRLSPGARLSIAGGGATLIDVAEISPRLVTLAFDERGDALWRAIYRHGRPVQYAHHRADLPLWTFQTLYAGRPWAVEMPSAGRPLSFRTLASLREAGVTLATLTHGAGLSATGDARLDRALPLRERYEIPTRTVAAIARTRAHGGRVLAVGTTVVRALEGALCNGGGSLAPGVGTTDLRIAGAHRLAVVDGLLSGLHSPKESHYALLQAFAPAAALEELVAHAHRMGYRDHELGDVCLILRGSLTGRAYRTDEARQSACPRAHAGAG